MTDRARGNLYVAIQFVFLGVLAFAPTGDLWTAAGLVGLAGIVLEFAGIAILAVAFANLGSSLTAHPVPRESATLKTTGLYAVVRHPIYLGLLSLGAGLTVFGASWWHVGALVGLSVLLHVKADFEERLLRVVYPEYEAYARRVGRLLPRVTVFRRGGR